MMQAVNYQLSLDKIVEKHAAEGSKPRLLLHCCCAPCASYCLEYLDGKFDITCFFYNPNITDEGEYYKRLEELKRFVLCAKNGAFEVVDGGFNPTAFNKIATGREDVPEGGARCFDCYLLRLGESYSSASSGGYDYFATTLTLSPHKNAQRLNEIGFELEKQGGTKYLPSDFKKKGGYKRSIELSKEYSLYRQDYCGCEFSRRAREEVKKSEQ